MVSRNFQKNRKRSGYRPRLGVVWVFLLAAASLGLPSAFAAHVVIDPGHGGQNTGARADSGMTEKQVTLALARQLARQLAPQNNVTLTRDDDVDLALPQRTAKANHLSADLFVSLHTAAAFQRRASGAILYLAESQALKTPNAPHPHQKWEQAHRRHAKENERLVLMVKRHFESAGFRIRIERAPMAVLLGADMPSILIEFGHLTNPEEAQKLAQPAFLQRMAAILARAINQFLAE